MKTWQKVVAVIGVAFVGFLGVAAMQPDSFEVHREIDVKAPVDKPYALMSDFHQWEGWSPWAKLDPSMKTTYSGAPTGVGQVYEWTGNDKVGQGRMEITALDPGKKIEIKLDFKTPFEAHNVTRFDYTVNGDTTHVKWTMTGPSPFVSKVFGLILPMDKMIGADFEKGLAGVKALAEK